MWQTNAATARIDPWLDLGRYCQAARLAEEGRPIYARYRYRRGEGVRTSGAGERRMNGKIRALRWWMIGLVMPFMRL